MPMSLHREMLVLLLVVAIIGSCSPILDTHPYNAGDDSIPDEVMYTTLKNSTDIIPSPVIPNPTPGITSPVPCDTPMPVYQPVPQKTPFPTHLCIAGCFIGLWTYLQAGRNNK